MAQERTLQLKESEYQQLAGSIMMAGASTAFLGVALGSLSYGLVKQNNAAIKIGVMAFIFVVAFALGAYIKSPKFDIKDKFIN